MLGANTDGRIMLHKQERQRRIHQIVQTQTVARVAQLRKELDVTAMTLWRDLGEMDEQGLLRRIRGGAQRVDVAEEPTFDTKKNAEWSAKRKIAGLAMERFFAMHGNYAMEGGTTVAELARRIAGKPATILTNSIPIVNGLREHGPDPSVYCSGGLLRTESGTLVGKEAITFFSRRKVDVFFMSASGLDLAAGLTDPNPMEIEVKQAMARAARRVVVLLDSSKLGKCSLMQILPLAKIHAMITDKPLPPEHHAQLARAGCAVICCAR
jgi:DeoR/GlpR family transcriptional regulator of sugar metabolism